MRMLLGYVIMKLMNLIKNKLLQCLNLDGSNNILNCINFTYTDENTDDIATLINNGTQHNLTKYNVSVQPVLIIYNMMGEYVVLYENDWIIQYSPTDFNIVNNDDFVEQFKLIDNEN